MMWEARENRVQSIPVVPMGGWEVQVQYILYVYSIYCIRTGIYIRTYSIQYYVYIRIYVYVSTVHTYSTVYVRTYTVRIYGIHTGIRRCVFQVKACENRVPTAGGLCAAIANGTAEYTYVNVYSIYSTYRYIYCIHI